MRKHINVCKMFTVKSNSVGLIIRDCLSSIPTGGDILSLDCFHVVKPLMSILSLLSILSIYEKLD